MLGGRSLPILAPGRTHDRQRHRPLPADRAGPARDAGALDRLLDSYRNYLRLLARTGIDASLQGKADPSDLVQDALLKAPQHFDQFRGATDAELAGWLRQILRPLPGRLRPPLPDRRAAAPAASSRWTNCWTARRRRSERILAANGTSPSASAQRRDLGVVLSDALAELSDDHREVIVLHHLEGLDWDEVAQAHGPQRRAPCGCCGRGH